MKDPRQIIRQGQIREAKARRAVEALQEAKLKALQDTLGSYGDLSYVDWDDFIDPDNQNWADYTYRLPSFMVSPAESAKRYGHIDRGTPVGMFIENVRDARTLADLEKQLEIWNSYKPLDSSDNGKSYIRYFIPGFGMQPIKTSGVSRPIQTSAGGTGGAQGVVTGGGTQGTQTGGTGTPSAQGGQTGNGVAKGGTASIQGAKTGGTDGTYASAGVPRGGTKTIGYDLYDPNPGNVSLAYTLRNEPEQVRRAALIAKWNQENGRSGSTYASPSISTGGTYATGEGIKDANGNVLTNPGGNWEYQYALKNPQYGLGMMGKMSDAQKNYLQAVSDNMGYKYNFTGATRFV